MSRPLNQKSSATSASKGTDAAPRKGQIHDARAPKKVPTEKRGQFRALLPWLALSLIWILMDQLTKLWVQSRLDLGTVIDITSFFNLVHVRNPGAAFSFLANQPGWQKAFLSGVAVVASCIIVYMMTKSHQKKFAMFCLASILGGAIGNLIDRSLYGSVIDFLDFYWNGYHWPAFNVADVAISCGAVGLILNELLFSAKEQSKE